jgi:TetR/AcrR family transcriptional repressor of nem operon
VAEQLMQSRGFNAFSYGDVASELGITRASLHYHFESKADLGVALVTRYTTRFVEALRQIETEFRDAPARLAAYVDLYAEVLRAQRMCLCGMMAADYATLPPEMRDAVVHFFDDNQSWLERVLEQGQAEGSMRFQGTARAEAQLVVSALEGAMLVARPYGDLERFQATAKLLLATFALSDAAAAPPVVSRVRPSAAPASARSG